MPKLPISIDDILKALALKNTVCSECHGMGSWRTKKRCNICNGKGSKGIDSTCSRCKGRGQSANSSGEPEDCTLCDGFGIIFTKCWTCEQTGCVVGTKNEYCHVCNGGGNVPFCHTVAKEADRPYIQYLVQMMSDYVEQGDHLEKAQAIDTLLSDSFQHASEQNPRNDPFSEEIRVAFNNAHEALAQKLLQCASVEKNRLKSLKKDRDDLSEILDSTRGPTTDSPNEYPDGLGYTD